MDVDWEERVRTRAYEIWEREGRPDDGADQHWLRAEEELLAEKAGVGIDTHCAPQTAAEQGVEDDPSREPTARAALRVARSSTPT